MLLRSSSAFSRASRSSFASYQGQIALGIVLQFGALSSAGCSGSEREHYPEYESAGAAVDSAANKNEKAQAQNPVSLARGACEDGAVVECKVLLPKSGDVTNCMVGLQVCEASQWSECLSEAEAEQRLPASR
ncbi:MAG TPA: hypothetical protein VHM70_29725 [Polyangiaceae bacterium]|jgi:hypothetical protein|nr:hypothetical protein [Polyangiaceae bacterium]